VSEDLRLMLVEDSEDDAKLVLRQLRRDGYEPVVRRVDDLEVLRDALAEPWDVVICDHSLPGFDAPAVLRLVKELGLDVPFIIVSGTIGEDAAVECMRAGAHDFVLKSNLSRLSAAVRREVAEARGRAEQNRTRARLQRSEDTLVRTEKLRALGQMAAGISHDLRNLLNPLSLHLQIVERSLRRGDIGPAAASIEVMKAALQAGLQTLVRLQAFGRQVPDVLKPGVDLDRLVREAIQLAKPRMASGRVSCSICAESNAPPLITAHAGEILSALVNLIINAIDAMPNGGTIVLRTGGAQDGAWVEVADDGPGMSPEVAARVFEAFFSTKGDAGTGLGLAMVQTCATHHGGTVSLDTALGQGAKFTLWFPAVPPARDPAP